MRKILAILLMIVCLGVSTQSKAQTCSTVPVINSFTPNTGFIGSRVTIFGANFDSNVITNNVVYFGSTKATVVSATFGQLDVIVPVGASTAPISVTNQCNRTAYSTVSFNGIFCPTPIGGQTYNNVSFNLGGINGAYNMISQDLDLDGKPEVISSANNGNLSIAVNNSIPGALSFTAINSNAGGQSIYAADFDGDGKKDLLSTSKVSRNISTPGVVSMAPFQSIPGVSSYQIAAGDFNNDGKIDIIGESGNNVLIAFNTSTGPGNIQFGPAQLFANVGSRCTGIQVADIDGDGKTDFVASQGGANRAVSVRNTTTVGSSTPSAEAPEFWASDSNPADGFGTFPYRAQIADFDKDGKIDFTSCNFQGATNVAIWRNISTVGDITFAPTINLPSPTNNYRIGVGDVDGDGYPDVVTKSLGINVFSVYKNTTSTAGVPTFATRIDYTSSAQAEVSGIVIGDLDGDFVPDIATSGISSNRILFHRNTSSQVDVTAPTAIAQNVVAALAPNGTVTVTAAQVNNGSSDACGIKTITLSQTLFTCANIGANPVTLTVTDNAGNVSTANAIVNVQPAAIIVSGQTTVCQGGTIPLTANLGDSYQWFRNGVTIAGATNQNFTATQTGSYTVAVTNAGGCSGTSLPTVVTVNDNPTVNILEGNSVYLCSGVAKLTASQSSIYQWVKDGVDIANATQQVYNATVAGNYSVRVVDLFGCSAVSSTVVVASGSPEIGLSEGVNAIVNNSISDFGNVFPNVNYTKTFTISNSGNNTLNISQLSISGVDAQYFTLNGAPSSVAANSSATFDVVFNAPNITTYNATVTLNNNDCDESSIIFSLKAEITCVAAAVTVPSDMVINTDVNNCSTTATYTANVVGAPAPSVTYTFSGATTGSGSGTGSGSIFNTGLTTVTVTAINPCGNSSQSFTVTVVDNVLPTVLTQNATIQLDVDGTASISTANINNGSTDNCGIASIVLDKTSFTCANVGANTVTLTVTDVNGNVSSATAVVTVQDNVAPIALTQNVTIQLNASGSASITTADINNGSNDACGILSLALSKLTFDCSNVGANTVTLTVTDVNGNVSTANATVTVQDNVAPIALTQNVTIQLNASGSASITTAAINNGSSDACGIASLALSKLIFDCSNVGDNAVILTVTDVNGNVSTANATVTVQDNVAPVALTQNVTIQLNASGSASITTAAINNGSSDACGIASLALSKLTFDCSNVGANTVTLTVTDVNGNVSTANATVTVQDNVAPIALTQNVTIQLNASGSASITTAAINNGSNDACGIASLALSKLTFNCSNVGANTVILTVTDVNGNVSTETATVTVQDNIAPTVITKNISVDLVGGNVSITAAQINNGSFDNCSIASLAINKTSFNCSSIGDHTVTLTVTDVNGNVSTGTAVVTVVGELTTSSIASVPTNTTYTGGVSTNLYLGYGAQSTTLQVSNLVSGGNGVDPRSYTYEWTGTGLSSTTSGSPVFTPTAAGFYNFSVIVTNKYGCKSNASISICVKDIREKDKNGKFSGKVFICHAPPGNVGNSNTLSISVNAVPSHLSQHSFDRLGTCADAPCTSSTGLAINSVGGNSSENNVSTIDLNVNSTEFIAYPNPFGKATTVRFTLPYQEDNATLDIYDLRGVKIQTLFNGNANAQTTYEVQFNGQNLSAGTYFFRLITAKEVKNFKVIMAE